MTDGHFCALSTTIRNEKCFAARKFGYSRENVGIPEKFCFIRTCKFRKIQTAKLDQVESAH